MRYYCNYLLVTFSDVACLLPAITSLAETFTFQCKFQTRTVIHVSHSNFQLWWTGEKLVLRLRALLVWVQPLLEGTANGMLGSKEGDDEETRLLVRIRVCASCARCPLLFGIDSFQRAFPDCCIKIGGSTPSPNGTIQWRKLVMRSFYDSITSRK